MSHFSEGERAYIAGQKLGRLATLGSAGEPNVVPVSFRYNTELDTIDISGHNMGKSKKFRNVQRDGRVSFVIDDVLPPWEARGIEIRGRAEALVTGDPDDAEFGNHWIRIYPEQIISWGIDSHPYTQVSRRTNTYTTTKAQSSQS